jgi:hypothetical protein
VERKVMLITALLIVFFSATQSFAGINLPSPIVQLPQNQEKIQYQMRFKDGDKYYLRFVIEQKISQTVSGRQQYTEQTIGLGCDLDVKSVDPNGNALERYTYKWVKLMQTAAGGKIVYDSSDKGSPVPPVAQGFVALLDEGFSLKTTPKGRVEEVIGLQTLRDNVERKLPEGPMKEALKLGIKQFINEEGIKEQMESSLAIYPDKPVGIGDSWKRTLTLTQGASMTLENEWTLKDRKDGISFIEVKSNLKSNPKAELMGMGSAKVSYDLSGKQQGMIEVEESTGRLIRSRINQDISGQIKVEVPGQQTQQPPIPVKINSIVTCEMTKRNDVKPVLNNKNVVVIDPNDPNAIMDRISAFEGLEAGLKNVEQQSENEITEWINGLEGSTPEVVQAIYEQIGAEFEFIREQAMEESAEKTTAVIDGLLLARSERLEKIGEKMQEDEFLREVRESRRSRGSRRGTRSRTGTIGRTGTIDSSYSRGRYDNTLRQDGRRTRQDMTNGRTITKVTMSLPFTDPNVVKAKIKTFEGLDKELKAVDRMGIRETRGWTARQSESSPILAKAVYKQVEDELTFTRKTAVEENAAKTTAAIDGLMLTRNERFERLLKVMQEERKRLREEQREELRTGRIRTR